MGTRYSVEHETRYVYETAVVQSWQLARLVPRTLIIAPLQLRHLRRRRDLREPAREEVVARKAARDVHDLAAQPDFLDVVEEDDFHRRVSL